MSPDEVETCLRNFTATHQTAPMTLIAGRATYEDILGKCAFNRVTGEHWFAGVKVLSDPLIKGIAISS